MKNIWLLGLLVFSMGCLATRQEVRDRDKVTPEQQQKAATAAREQEFDEHNRQVMGKIESLENQIQRLNAEKSASLTERANEKRALEEKLKIYEEAISKLETQNLLLGQKVEAMQTALTERSLAPAVKEAGGAPTKNSFQVAEDLYDGKKYVDAILAYDKYRENNPSGKRYAEATFKMGQSFQELGKKSDARAFYSEVIEKFPRTEWSKKANNKLKAMK